MFEILEKLVYTKTYSIQFKRCIFQKRNFRIMKFQKYLADTQIAEWKNSYVDYKGLKKTIKNMQRNDNDFIIVLQNELLKVSTFYNSQASTIFGRLAFIQNEMSQNTNRDVKSLKRIQILYRELYTFCTYLHNFQKLNMIAFTKIIKKYDKSHDATLTENICYTFVEDRVFKNDGPKQYEKLIEADLTKLFDILKKRNPALFSRYLITLNKKNSRSLTMTYLRGPLTRKDDFSFFRVGLFVGISVPLIIMAIETMVKEQKWKDPVYIPIFYIMGGMFVNCLSIFGFAIDIYIWKRHRINYIFILEMDYRTALTFKQFAEFGAISLLLWSITGFFVIHDTLHNIISFQYIPLMLIFFYIALFLLPLPILHHRSRIWFLKTLGRVFTPGFRKVDFKDFFIADLFISLTFFWTSLYVLICFYIDRNICSPRQSWITPFLISIPLIIRLIQCLRRFYDGKENLNLINAGKYIVSIFAVFASSLNVIKTGLPTLLVYIAVAVISSCYSYTWDTVIDWGIKKNGKLIGRKKLITACIFNFFLRFNFILTINIFFLFDQLLLSFIFSCLEVIRRYIWAVFRMELEHTQNVEHYRAVVDIPLLPEANSE